MRERRKDHTVKQQNVARKRPTLLKKIGLYILMINDASVKIRPKIMPLVHVNVNSFIHSFINCFSLVRDAVALDHCA